jgi:hypothetical protein
MTLRVLRLYAPASVWTLLAVVLAAALTVAPASAQTGVRFDGTNDYVTFGSSSQLMLSDFTVEVWFRRDAAGATTTTGTGGWAAIVPLITKGRGESETATLNMNYFLGIRSDGRLAADFEESTGPNHPIGGTTAIANNTWYHAAVTYDHTTGRYTLYLNGAVEKDTTLTAGISPDAGSIQHAGLATAMTSAGTAAGFFAGVLDEARIWNYARTQAEIQGALAQEVGSGTGLVARWGLNDGSGTTAANSVAGGVGGTLTNGPVWEGGAPFTLTANSLQLSGTNGYVTFGSTSALGAPAFTLEGWLRRDGAGVAVSTGTGGITAVPLITKGRGEAETPANLNMNYFLGIDGTTGALTADFEDTATGLNHPVAGVTPLTDHTWYHAAATYDGTTWRLYLDGTLDRELVVGAYTPEATSIQHAGLGTAMTSTGVASGYFNGVLDEVRIWNYARSGAEIAAAVNTQITTAQSGLVGRWALNEGTGTTVYGSAGTTVNGTLTGTGWGWWAAAPFDAAPPAAPAAPSGLGATALSAMVVRLAWTDNSDNETGFEIERSTTGSGGPFSPLATVAAGVTTYDDAPLSALSEYCYRVRAVNAVGGSAYAGPACATTLAAAAAAVDFGGTGGYATFGANPALGLAQFTIETWFRRDATGVTTTTGTGGITDAIPLVTKGRGEAEASNVDMNWFLGISAGSNVLGADFEEGAAGASPGLNHPVLGVTPITTGLWYHAAATYDGATWRLYLNGNLERELVVGQPVRSDCIQHAGLATGLNSTGAAAGYFAGALDEVRVWDYARTPEQILASVNEQITVAQTGLVARWALDEGAGSRIFGSAGTTVNGTLVTTDWTWTGGAPFNIEPPSPPAAPTALDATSTSATRVVLTWSDNADNEIGYEIQRSTAGSGGPFAALDSVAGNSSVYEDAAVSPLAEYCYRVRAYNGAGVSEFSNVDCVTTPSEPNCALDFSGAYVTFGAAPELALSAVTLECWFRRDGAGTAASTGSGGVSAIPLVTKGMHESDGSNVDMNWFLGIEATSGVLVADFEEGADGSTPGLNHPVMGVTPVGTGVWHHAAATYDGATWKLYLDGLLEYELLVNEPLRSDCIQHAGLATAMNSTGVTEGAFDGALDEVRVWNHARTDAEIRTLINTQLTAPQTGLVARWGLNECSGTTVAGSAGTLVDGTVTGAAYAWVSGAPFDLVIDLPPALPVLVAPPDDATDMGLVPSLRVDVSDPESGPLTVTYYGRPKPEASGGPDFTLVGLPDTQYYTTLAGGSATFNAQTQWIVDNRVARNIAYVTHYGDIVESGDNSGDPAQWLIADGAMDRLDDPVGTGLPEGIPFGMAVGNHDQSPNGDAAGTTTFYNQYFGTSRFSGRSYYGGNYGDNNDGHFDLFSASGLDFIVVYMEYDAAPDAPVLVWADSLLAAYGTRHGIVVVHNLIGTGNPGAWSAQGTAVYNALRDRPNLFLMLCGHAAGEGQRADTYEGNTIYTVMADYQSRTNGGDGWLRLMEFSPADNEVRFLTYSPTLNQWETDTNSQFAIPHAMTASVPFDSIGQADNVASGTTASVGWPDRLANTEYEWYVTVTDGSTTVTGPVWSFTTGSGSTAVEPIAVSQLRLAPVTPNPSRNGAQVRFDLPRPAKVRVSVLDLHGRVVGVLADGELAAGRHTMRWDGRTKLGAAAAGMYFIELQAEGQRLVQRGVVLK